MVNIKKNTSLQLNISDLGMLSPDLLLPINDQVRGRFFFQALSVYYFYLTFPSAILLYPLPLFYPHNGPVK